MGIQAAPVYWFQGQGGFTWPDVTWEGAAIKRRAALYGEVWYAEYACWDMTSGAEWTVGDGGVTADFYLISPGETGAAGSTAGGGMGGGAGAGFTWLGVDLPAGDYAFVISQTETRVSGQIDPLVAVTPSGGETAGTAYQLYGDSSAAYGQAGARGAPTSIAPGSGAVGCAFLSVRAASTVFGSSSSRVSLAQGALGAGAGGNGGGRTDYMASALQTLVGPGVGAAGMALMRVALTSP
ncbi:MAG: hypothetical protein LBS11_10345 [Oscillospiraceae bacterium]|jgi:hypothetical protein|nr:hypothetical protein [Oscillospiraceae bacterium]